ncbi:hypothetical protein [Acidocella facilis]|uniref:hypothetical protein n=1 Tax=Acidocella facilis TaxID=525 RepID=UPI001F3F2253|nr:hypothetical protein [Acidocella facilis]
MKRSKQQAGSQMRANQMTKNNATGGEKSPLHEGKKAKPKTATKPNRAVSGTVKRSSPPPLPNDGIGGVTGWRGQLFTVEDVATISSDAGVIVLQDKLDAAPEKLRQAFDFSLSWLETPELSSPPSVHRDWLAEVHKQAELLLKVLHFPPGEETINEHDLVLKWVDQKIQRRSAPLLLLGEWFAANQSRHFFALPKQVQDVFRHYPEQQGQDEYARLQAGTMAAMLEIAPWLIAVISEVGRKGAEHWSAEPQAVRGKEPFPEMLFLHLANVYEELTGTPPSGIQGSGADAGTIIANAPPLLWVKSILHMAAERLLGVTSGYGDEAVKAIRAAATLSDSRISRLFKPTKNEKKTGNKSTFLEGHDKGENQG